VGLPLLVGVADAAAVQGSLRGWYQSLAAPPGTPSVPVFAAVCSALYVLIGIAAWLVWRDLQLVPALPGSGRHMRPLRVWGWQLLCSAAWAPAFFGLHNPPLGLAVLLVLVWLIGLTILTFRRVRPLAAGLILPYLAWTCYAACLNAGFCWLNASA
jgi:benzodiazapine receptor